MCIAKLTTQEKHISAYHAHDRLCLHSSPFSKEMKLGIWSHDVQYFTIVFIIATHFIYSPYNSTDQMDFS